MTLIYYSQKDKRWADVPYTISGDKKQTIGATACGPTSFAMAASTFLCRTILPTETAKYAIDKGYRTTDNGTAWTYYASISKAYGLECKQTGSLDEVKKTLKNGSLVIASMGKGNFTSGGHYILLTGINDAWIDVLDPNQDNTKYGNDKLIKQGVKNDGKVSAHSSVFQKEAKQYWIIDKGEDQLKLDPAIANDIIAKYLIPAWGEAKRKGDKVSMEKAHSQANALRVAAGLAEQ